MSMCYLEQFKVDLKGLTEGEIPFDYSLDDQFFRSLEDAQLQSGLLHVSGSIRKATGFYELLLHISGTVRVPCDRCLEMMDQSIDSDHRAVVKLGTAPLDEDDTIFVDERDGQLDLSWLIYETTALAVPIQHVHQPGDCNVAMSEKLQELSAARSSDADADAPVDPRWEKLLKLRADSAE